MLYAAGKGVSSTRSVPVNISFSVDIIDTMRFGQSFPV